MSREEIRAAVLGCLGEVAPEADLAAIRADRPLRDQLDIDSIDFLNFVIGLDRSLHVAVPESDYGALATLDACVEYLAPRVPP
jgi:acyl carrier protein